MPLSLDGERVRFMRNIYFVRHSIQDLSVQDDASAPLTKAGNVLAKELTRLFINKSITAIYSSPYARAFQTVLPTAEKLDLIIDTHADLRERQAIWRVDWQEHLANLWQDFELKADGEESFADVERRIVPAFQQIYDDTEGDIIITGHGTALSVLFHHLTHGQFTFSDWQNMNMPDVYIGHFSDKNVFVGLEKIAR